VKGEKMSEIVKIGGIRKNPAIDRVNGLNSKDIKSTAKSKMESFLRAEEFARSSIGMCQVSMDFGNVGRKSE